MPLCVRRIPERSAQPAVRGARVMMPWLPKLVARVRVSVRTKLLGAFLAIVVLLITVGATGLRGVQASNRRAEDLLRYQRQLAAYRQLQHDTMAELYHVVSSLLGSNER